MIFVPQVIFVDEDILPSLEKVSDDVLSTIKLFVVCGVDMRSGGWSTTLPADKCVDFDEFLASGSPFYEWPIIDERSASSLCYTSGTTGNPKGVAYSHRSTYIHTHNGVITTASSSDAR